MSDNTLNKALLIMSCDCPRRRLLRALEGVVHWKWIDAQRNVNGPESEAAAKGRDHHLLGSWPGRVQSATRPL
jgi:hypothetical protein